jgi:hypothetical protein
VEALSSEVGAICLRRTLLIAKKKSTIADALAGQHMSTSFHDIMCWASTVPYEQVHETAYAGRTPNTALWLLAHEDFREWRHSRASMILWLHGIRKSRFHKLPTSCHSLEWMSVLQSVIRWFFIREFADGLRHGSR